MRKKRAITRDQAIKEIVHVYTHHIGCGNDEFETDYNYWKDQTNKCLLMELNYMYTNIFEIVPNNKTTKVLYGVDNE